MALGFLMLTACTAQYPLNPKLGDIKRAQPYQSKLFSPERSDELLLVLAFSGGGTRAAALSYGVLEALERVEIPGRQAETAGRRHSLLDEVDVVSAVSVGSFTAAYFGLYGKAMFKDYRERFLLKDHQGTLLWRFFNPLNWPRLSSPRFGRSDLAQEYYDEILFRGATLGDLADAPGPAVLILSTDIIDGLTFPFTPGQFSLICSDFEKFPVARAVAASSAFPGALTPVVLKNYAGQCRARMPAAILESLQKPDLASRRYDAALRLKTYLDPQKKPYIHLLDGGIADNLGVKGLMEAIEVQGGIRQSLAESGLGRTKKVAFIIVDAKTREKAGWSLVDDVPGLNAIFGAASTIMINRYSYETLSLLRHYVHEWQSESGTGCSPIDFHVIHVAFDFLPEEKDREYFNNIPTTLVLPPEEVDRLAEAGGRLLYGQREFVRLVSDLGGKWPEPQTTGDAQQVGASSDTTVPRGQHEVMPEPSPRER